MTDLERIKKDVVEMDSRANVCWYDTKVLTKAVRLILEELTAGRKTENSSEKPNNCETCKYGEDKHRYAHICNERGVGINNYEPKTEPQTYITEDRDTQILDAWQVNHRNTTSVEDEPQTERSE